MCKQKGYLTVSRKEILDTQIFLNENQKYREVSVKASLCGAEETLFHLSLF